MDKNWNIDYFATKAQGIEKKTTFFYNLIILLSEYKQYNIDFKLIANSISLLF